MSLRRRGYLLESVDPRRFTEKQFWAKIDRAASNKYATTSTMDWGGNRGQGKRHGRMVMGGMSDPPKGKKSYTDILGKAPLNKAGKEEAGNLEDIQKLVFVKALAAGFSSDVAFVASYTVGSDPMSRAESFKLARETK